MAARIFHVPTERKNLFRYFNNVAAGAIVVFYFAVGSFELIGEQRRDGARFGPLPR